MRCKACNTILNLNDSRGTHDTWDYCYHCIGQSNRQFNINDIAFDHGDLTGVPVDGSTLFLEDIPSTDYRSE